MLTDLPIPSRDQGKLFDHRANEEAYFTRYATHFGFALPKGETALDVPQCRVVPEARPSSLLTWLLHGTRLTNPKPDHAT